MRSNLKSHSDAAVAASVAYGNQIKIYPLSQATNPPETKFTHAQDTLFDGTIRYDVSFFEGLNRVIQTELWLERDRAMIDQLKTLGIEKGKPFNPTAETKAALNEGIREAQAWLEAKYDAGLPPYWEGSRWTYPAPADLIKVAQAGFSDPDDYPIDNRGMVYSTPSSASYPLRYYALNSPKAVAVGGAFVNDFKKYPELKTAKDRFVVTPNNVTIDAYAEPDLTAEPVVIVVPPLAEQRWYIVQIGDSFDEITRNIGGTKGAQPGVYIVTEPDFAGSVPGDMTQIKSRTKIGVAAVRILANGASDLPRAVEAQKGFRLMPLSAYLRQGLAYVSSEPRSQTARYDGTAPPELRYFDELGFAMEKRLPASADNDDALVASFHQIGLSVGKGFEWQTLDEATRRGLAGAITAGSQIVDSEWAAAGQIANGWKYTFAGGRAGYDPGLRAALAKNELGAQLSDQVLDPNTSVDDKGEGLTGARKYVLHFDKGQLPPVSVFWNMAMYGSDMLFVENDFGRYSIGSTTDGLKPGADGSLTMLIQKDNPADTANWLPAPSGSFNLTLRRYGPETPILDGSYRLPAIKRVRLKRMCLSEIIRPGRTLLNRPSIGSLIGLLSAPKHRTKIAPRKQSHKSAQFHPPGRANLDRGACCKWQRCGKTRAVDPLSRAAEGRRLLRRASASPEERASADLFSAGRMATAPYACQTRSRSRRRLTTPPYPIRQGARSDRWMVTPIFGR